MSSELLTFEQVHSFLVEKGGKVRNRDAVRYFKSYLTHAESKDENRQRFKEFINTLATTRSDNDEKLLVLKPKYFDTLHPPLSPSFSLYKSPSDARTDPRNSLGIPSSPSNSNPSDSQSSSTISPLRQPPPYRPPPQPVYSSTTSLDTLSIGSLSSVNDTRDDTPQAPPRRRESMRSRSVTEISTPKRQNVDVEGNTDDAGISVKERTQKFNRLASVEDELSPRHTPKSAEKENRKPKWGGNDEECSSTIPLEPKKCMEWYVTASKGDYQELLRLANQEPRLVNKKDPFTTVLHWGAKYGNADIIKSFAGKYKVNVNGKTGYTPLHISAQFGHKDLFKLMIEVYKADPNIRDYSGRTAEFYLMAKEQKEGTGITGRKLKGRKKQSEKDLGFLRIGSLNVRVKKTTEAFSNFLGVGSATINPLDTMQEKVHKGWGSADNVNKDNTSTKSYGTKKKKIKQYESGRNSTPSTPRTPTRSFASFNPNDSDSDTAAGFDSNWKN